MHVCFQWMSNIVSVVVVVVAVFVQSCTVFFLFFLPSIYDPWILQCAVGRVVDEQVCWHDGE